MLALSRKSLAVLLPLLSLGGCGSDNEFTADVAGSYTIAITNGASTCKFDNWVEGKETSGIGLTITQDGQKVHATLDGVIGGLFTCSSAPLTSTARSRVARSRSPTTARAPRNRATAPTLTTRP